jgi:hypothetical protein
MNGCNTIRVDVVEISGSRPEQQFARRETNRTWESLIVREKTNTPDHLARLERAFEQLIRQ